MIHLFTTTGGTRVYVYEVDVYDEDNEGTRCNPIAIDEATEGREMRVYVIEMEGRSCYLSREEVAMLSTCIEPTMEEVQQLRCAHFPTWRMFDNMRVVLRMEKSFSCVRVARVDQMTPGQVLLTIAMHPADIPLGLEESRVFAQCLDI